MKTKALTIVSVFFVAIIVIWSCSKKDDTKYTSDGAKENVFPSGQPNNNFANGGSNNVFAGNGGGGNILPGDDCAVGTWTTPKDTWSSCPQTFHLKLTFNSGGTGEAWHLDPYLCLIDMHKMFTWKHERDSMFIKFDDDDVSESKFICPANQMVIYWNFGNFKLLTRQ